MLFCDYNMDKLLMYNLIFTLEILLQVWCSHILLLDLAEERQK